MILFGTIKPELFEILTTEPAFSTGVYRDEWASCLKGEKSLKTVQVRVIISCSKGSVCTSWAWAGCGWAVPGAGHSTVQGTSVPRARSAP